MYKEEERKAKMCFYHSKKEVEEKFERKMNQDVNGNWKFSWKEVSKANVGKSENSNRIKDGNGRLVLEEAVHFYGFDVGWERQLLRRRAD